MQLIHQTKCKPEELVNLASYYATISGTTLLFSGSTYDSAESSYLFLFPFDQIEVSPSTECWNELRNALKFESSFSNLPEWVGYLTYEMGSFSDQEKVVEMSYPDYPIALFRRYTLTFHYDHKGESLSLYLNQKGATDLKEVDRLSSHTYLQKLLSQSKKESSEAKVSLLKPLEEKEAYYQKVEKAKQLIYEGEIYQVNISQEAIFESSYDAFIHYQALSRINPAPFSAYMRINSDHAFVSSSPERLLNKRGNRLETRPIKGTAPRGKTLEEDEQNRKELEASEKDGAELLMITDLMRNDLSRISLPGTVKVEKIQTCEAYQNVFHLLSVISSKVATETHPVEILRECFPGGSITGCPKLRAMEVIQDIERSTRGIYTGTIGYFSGNGDFDFNICIRTLDCQKGKVKLRLGGAIVTDSTPELEYEETLHKGESLFAALKQHHSV